MAKSLTPVTPDAIASAATTTASTPAGAFVRALGDLGHGVLLLEGERIVEVSRAFSELTGYDRDLLLDMSSAFDLAPPEERPRLRALLRRYVAGEDVGRRFAIPIATASGEVIEVDVAVKSIGRARGQPQLLVVTSDITERRDYQDRLQFQKRLLEAVAEIAIDAIKVVATDGRILYSNRRYAELWDVSAEALASERDDALVAVVRSKVVDPELHMRRVGYLKEHPLEESVDELRLRDGRVIERYSAPVLDEDSVVRARVWFYRDVTEETGGRRANELLALSGELFGSSLDVDATLSQVVQLVVPRMADWAAVDVLDESDNFRRVGVAHLEPQGEQLLRDLHEDYPLRPNEGHLRGRVVSTLEPIALYDVSEDELRSLARDEEHYQMLRKLGIRSAMWLPLIVRDRVVGVLSAGYRDGTRRYRPADLELLRELARRAALAVDNALLYRAVNRGAVRQAAVAELGQKALAGMPSLELAQSAAELLARIMDVPFVEVLELTPDKRRLQLVAGVGWRPGLVGTASVRAGLGSQGGYTLATVGPVVVDSLANETRFRPPPLLANHGVVSGLTVVIGGPPRPFGVLGAHTDSHHVFAEDDVSFLQAMANVLAAAVDRESNEKRLDSLASAELARAAQLKVVLESIGDPVVVCDAQGSVLLANPAADDLLGGHIADGLAGILTAFEFPSGRSAEDLGPREGIEVRLIDGQGTENERWFELSTYPVRSGEAVSATGGTILVIRDVTVARNARIVREAFLGMLSHELRTPVTTIYGGSEILSRRASTLAEEERRSVYEDIRAEADRLYRLVENLLVLSRVERQGLHIETEPVLLQRLIPRVVEAESERWPNARFVASIAPGLPPVVAEETYIEQVLRNLLSNAAKYGGDGPITVSAHDGDAEVRVIVRDSGPGFPTAEGDRLFELFFRSPSSARSASGAGIGLFVSRQLVAAMSGRIWAKNRPEGGAEFGFQIPIFAAADTP